MEEKLPHWLKDGVNQGLLTLLNIGSWTLTRYVLTDWSDWINLVGQTKVPEYKSWSMKFVNDDDFTCLCETVRTMMMAWVWSKGVVITWRWGDFLEISSWFVLDFFLRYFGHWGQWWWHEYDWQEWWLHGGQGQAHSRGLLYPLLYFFVCGLLLYSVVWYGTIWNGIVW